MRTNYLAPSLLALTSLAPLVGAEQSPVSNAINSETAPVIQANLNHPPAFTESTTVDLQTTVGASPLTFTWYFQDLDVADGSIFPDSLTIDLIDDSVGGTIPQGAQPASRYSTSFPLNGSDYTLEENTLQSALGGTLRVIDYVPPSSPDGPVDGYVTLEFTPDTINYGTEYFSATITDNAGASTTRSVSITVQPVAPAVPFIGVGANDPIKGITLIENDASVAPAVSFVRSSATDDIEISYSLTGTASNGVDYAIPSGDTFTRLSGTITMLAGNYTAEIQLSAIDDDLVENDENITITITAVNTLTINNRLSALPASGTLASNAGYTIVGGVMPAAVGTLFEGRNLTGTVTLTLQDDEPAALLPNQIPRVNQVISSATATPTFFTFSAGSPDALAALKAALRGKDNTQVRGFSWDAATQTYVELPAEPTGGLTRDHAVFLVTRINLGLNQTSTTFLAPYSMTLKPGWNFIGVPVLTMPNRSIATSHPWAAFDAGGAAISSPYTWNGSAYVVASTLDVGTGYWVKNNTTSDVTLVRTTTTTAPALPVQSAARAQAAHDTPPAPPSSSVAAPQATGGSCGSGSGIGLIFALGWLARLGLRSRRS